MEVHVSQADHPIGLPVCERDRRHERPWLVRSRTGPLSRARADRPPGTDFDGIEKRRGAKPEPRSQTSAWPGGTPRRAPASMIPRTPRTVGEVRWSTIRWRMPVAEDPCGSGLSRTVSARPTPQCYACVPLRLGRSPRAFRMTRIPGRQPVPSRPISATTDSPILAIPGFATSPMGISGPSSRSDASRPRAGGGRRGPQAVPPVRRPPSPVAAVDAPHSAGPISRRDDQSSIPSGSMPKLPQLRARRA